MRKIKTNTRLKSQWYTMVYVTLTIVLINAQFGFAGVYHVSKTGNDGNIGTINSPYLTISKAALIAQPGDSVIVHSGLYREWVQPERGGTSESTRITYKAAAGEKVVVKGSEQISAWENQGNGIWKVDLSDAYFARNGDWRPFKDTIGGRYMKGSNGINGQQYISDGSWCHLGEVYLNGQIYLEKQTLDEIKSAPQTWYTLRNDTIQSIYANFGKNNPNKQLAEINVRQACFGKDVQTGIDFVTVDGFKISQSAEEWLPTFNRTNSRGAIFSSGSNWIIQNCMVSFAKMRGIVIDGGINHIIRNNIIENCGSAGIGGANANGAVVSGNWIRNIHGLRPYYGPEHGGIKFHTSSNQIISGNIISNVTAPAFGQGIWLDYAKGNTRITGNVIMNVSANSLYLENPSGPNLIDNNVIMYGSTTFEDGNILINNLFVNVPMGVAPGGWGNTSAIYNKSFNNIYIYGSSSFPVKPGNAADYNAYLNGGNKSSPDSHSVIDNSPTGFKIIEVDTINKSVNITFHVPASVTEIHCPIVTTQSIDSLQCQKSFFTMKNQDGTPFVIDRDFFQICRGSSTHVGPFVNLCAGQNRFVLKPNSNFIYTTKCIPQTAQPPQPSVTKASVGPTLPDINNRVIVAYELGPQDEARFDPLDTNISLFWNKWDVPGNRLDYVYMDPTILNGWHASYPTGNHGKSDANVTIRMVWGTKGLYVLFIITDDHFVDLTDTTHSPAGDVCEFFLEPHATAEIATHHYWRSMQMMGSRASVPNGCTQDMAQFRHALGFLPAMQWLHMLSWPDTGNTMQSILLSQVEAAEKGVNVKVVEFSKQQRAQEWFIAWSHVGTPSKLGVSYIVT